MKAVWINVKLCLFSSHQVGIDVDFENKLSMDFGKSLFLGFLLAVVQINFKSDPMTYFQKGA